MLKDMFDIVYKRLVVPNLGIVILLTNDCLQKYLHYDA